MAVFGFEQPLLRLSTKWPAVLSLSVRAASLTLGGIGKKKEIWLIGECPLLTIEVIPVICAYVDEAGNTGKNLDDMNQPYHYVGAILIPEDKWRAVKDDLDGIANYVLEKGIGSDYIELHGSSIYLGSDPWRQATKEFRHEIYRAALELLVQYDLWIVYGCCNKPELKRRGYPKPLPPQYIAFWLCLERIADYINRNGSLGFIVADDTDHRLRTTTLKVLSDYRKNGPPFGKEVDISCVIDTVHFMHSHESRHLQLCDLALYALQRLRVRGDDMNGLAWLATQRVLNCKTFPY